jgi:hypothetical protein
MISSEHLVAVRIAKEAIAVGCFSCHLNLAYRGTLWRGKIKHLLLGQWLEPHNGYLAYLLAGFKTLY